MCSTYTHLVLNGVFRAEDLWEGVASQCVPQRGLGQETCGIGCIVDVFDGRHGIADPKLDNGININRHTVFSENLQPNDLHIATRAFMGTLMLHI